MGLRSGVITSLGWGTEQAFPKKLGRILWEACMSALLL